VIVAAPGNPRSGYEVKAYFHYFNSCLWSPAAHFWGRLRSCALA
jgi:hypothetical protein